MTHDTGCAGHRHPWTPCRKARRTALPQRGHGAGREANSEFFARIRRVFDDAGVHWQTHSYDAGYGGSTIASWFAGQNMDVIDVGIGIVSMHSPYEVSSKVDLWELYRGFGAFYAQ